MSRSTEPRAGRAGRLAPRLVLVVLGWLALAAFLWLAAPAAAATYYVATTGLDTNPGTEAQPWQTIGKCALTMVAGDTCLVRAGTYTGGGISPTNNGTAGNRITFRAYPGERPLLDGGGFNLAAGRHYITIDGFECRKSLSCAKTANDEGTSSSNIVIRNMYIHDVLNAANDNTAGVRLDSCGSCIVEQSRIHTVCNNCTDTNNPATCLCRDKNAAAIQAFNSWNATARYNRFYDTGEGVFIKSAPGATGTNAGFEKPGPHWTIHNNYVHDVDEGVWMSVAGGSGCSGDMPHKGVTVYNNVFDNVRVGVLEDSPNDAYDGCRDSEDLVIYNNTFGDSTDEAILFGGWSGTNKAYNNLFVGNADEALQGSAYHLVDYNVYLTGKDRFDLGSPSCPAASCGSIAALRGATTFEDNGQVAASAGFVAGTFRVAAGSPLATACREGGVVGGAVVACGAPANLNDTVGLAPGAATGVSVTP